MKLQCDMVMNCCEPVTHLGEKGFTYCATHAKDRRTYERTRKLRKWELDILHTGGRLPSYAPISKQAAMAMVRR